MRFWYKLTHMRKTVILKKLLSYDDVYLTAVRRLEKNAGLPDNPEGEFHAIPYDRRYWYADPVLFTDRGRSFLFMEAFDKKRLIGRIACAELGRGKPVPRIVLSEAFHLSFPRVFQWGEAIYMIPESADDSSIRLYRATAFPDKWELVKRFPVKKRYVDTIVTETDRRHVRLLTSEYSPTTPYACRYQKLYLRREADDYVLEEDAAFNAAQSFDYFSRNAGALFVRGGQTLLPAQESTAVEYGRCLNFYAYRESEQDITKRRVGHVEPKQLHVRGFRGTIDGVHSYSRNDRFEVIDVRYMEWLPDKYLRRLWKRIGGRWSR